MKTSQVYKLILADDHILLRDALEKLINNFEEFTVVASACNGKEVIRLMENGCHADIVLMDLNMPELDGYHTAKWLAQQHPGVKIIILTMYDSEIALIRMLQAGVYGYLKKDIHPDELKAALMIVANGDYYYSNHTTNMIASLFKNTPSIEKSILNTEEIEFLKLASTEMTYKEIARVMKITPRGIDRFRDTLFQKLNVKSRVSLAIYAVKNGLISF